MLAAVKAHAGPICSVSWRTDGGIVTGGLEGTVSLWRFDNDAELATEEYAKRAAAAKKDDKPEAPPTLVTSIRNFERAHPMGVASVSCNNDGTGRFLVALERDD